MITALAASLLFSPAWIPERVIGRGWGLNLGFNDLSAIERQKIASSGVKWIRRDLFWHVVEPKKGEWDWSIYDRLLDDLKPMGIKPVFILCYGNGLYQSDAPRSPEARAAFCRYVQKAVSRYKGRGIIWELWNEPNNHHWQPKSNVQDYIRLSLDAGRAFKQAAPDEKLVGPALAGFDWPFIEACFKAGLLKHWDGVTVHPYRPMEPESGVADYARLSALISRHAPEGKKIPILCGEIGFSDISVKGKGQQADYFLRQYLVNLASNVPLTIWYNFSDNGSEPQNSEHHYGVVGLAPEFKDKPAFVAAKTLTSAIAGFRFSKRLAWGRPDDWLLLFTKGGQSALVAWTVGQTPTSLPQRLLHPFFTVKDREGRAIKTDRPSLTGTPIIITYPQGWKPELAKTPELPLFHTVDSPSDLAAALMPFKERSVQLASGSKTLSFRVKQKPESRLSSLARFKDRSRNHHDVLVTHGGVPQRITLYHASPIDLLAASEGLTASVTVAPQGRGFVGEVEIASGAKKISVPVSVPAGSTTRVAVSDPSKPFTVRLLEKGKEVRREGPWQMLPLSLHGARISTEGDAKIEGSATATPSKAEDGPAKSAESLLLNYSFGKGWKYALLSPPKPVPVMPGTDRLTYWVKGSGTGVLLLMRYEDSTGQTFQPEGVPVDWMGWRAVTFALDGSTGGRWGGANDGKVHLPIKITSLAVLDNPRGMGMSGRIELAAPTFIRTLSTQFKGE